MIFALTVTNNKNEGGVFLVKGTGGICNGLTEYTIVCPKKS